MPQYFLNDDDRKRLDAALKRLDKMPLPEERGYTPPDATKTADTYVGILPCSDEVPGRVGNLPGKGSVCLYKFVTGNETGSNPNYTLAPVYDALGKQVRITIWNIYPEKLTALDGYINLKRTKSGRWLNERPIPQEDEDTTTTAEPPEPPTPPSPCDTELEACGWTWDAYFESWIPDIDNEWICNVGSGTDPPEPSTTPEPPDPCASDSANCECCPQENDPDDDPTTMPPEPSTTSTPYPPGTYCYCQYPTYCGYYEGERTYTPCTIDDSAPPLECSTTTPTSSTTTCDPSDPSCTTSSTCDCNTSSTSSPCSGSCTWKSVTASSGTSWQKLTDTCSAECPCPEPSSSGECGNEETTYCEEGPYEPPDQTENCSGNCQFKYSDATSSWNLLQNTCSGGNISSSSIYRDCWCTAPGTSGVDCEEITVPCSTNPTSPPGGDPCEPCYSTEPPGTSTSTTEDPDTSTTEDPCGLSGYPEYGCSYVWSVECDQWILVPGTGNCDICNVDCPDYLDGVSGKTHSGGDGKRIPCPGSVDPTSGGGQTAGGTGSKSTEPPATPAPCDTGSEEASCVWKYSCDCDPPAWVEISNGCNMETCPCSFPDYESNRSQENYSNSGSPANMRIQTTVQPACNQYYRNYCLSANTSTTATPSAAGTPGPPSTPPPTMSQVSDTTTCDPTTTDAPDPPEPSTTVCPTSTTEDPDGSTTSCNPAADCEEPDVYQYRCGRNEFDDAMWGTCCCEGPCCVYAKNPIGDCADIGDGGLISCQERSVVWQCGDTDFTGNDCCQGANCDYYFLGKGFTCEDCPDDHTGPTTTSSTVNPFDCTTPCEWKYTATGWVLQDWGGCKSDTCDCAAPTDTPSVGTERDVACVANPTGACCYDFGTECEDDVTKEVCSGRLASWWSDYATCDNIDCDHLRTTAGPSALGSCCYRFAYEEDEEGIFASDWKCEDNVSNSWCDDTLTGIWNYVYSCNTRTDCTSTLPPETEGSCCHNYGECEDGDTLAECAARTESVWQPLMTCAERASSFDGLFACATTTAAPCSGTCNWSWNGTTWSLASNDCSGGCAGSPCVEPAAGPPGFPTSVGVSCIA